MVASYWLSLRLDMITREELQEQLDYNPETGVFVWKVAKGSRADLVGKIAGHNHGGYNRITIGGTRYFAHQLAWLWETGTYPQHEIDHKNGDRSDNRIANLRKANDSQNKLNLHKLYKNNTSGHRNVSWDEGEERWRALGYVDGKQRVLKRCKSKEEAAMIASAHLDKTAGEYRGSV